MENQHYTYCRVCGEIIDPVSKKCSGCGKQYFKGVSLKTSVIIMLCIILAASFAGNIVLGIDDTRAREELVEEKNDNEELKSDVKKLKEENKTQKRAYQELETTHNALVEENRQTQETLNATSAELDFYDRCIVLVADNGSKKYHKYDCYIFQNCDSFWAYNTEAAEANGYTACPQCHN